MSEQFINKLVSQPWEIGRARGRALIASFVQQIRSKRPLKSERPEEDCFGDPLPKMQIVGDVAIIPIYGTLALNLPDWVKAYGLNMTDINDIALELAQAMTDARVAMIVLDFDSPGGWSIAGQKLFDLVEQAQRFGGKPVFAWCADGSEVCSAAFHGATPAAAFLTGRYAVSVGCIGTYLAVLDDSKFWEMMGITVEVLRSGELKGMGEDGFSEAQLAFLQSTVDECGDLFRKNVARYRTDLDAAEMEGQWYAGDRAARLGFTHGVANDLAAAIQKFRTF